MPQRALTIAVALLGTALSVGYAFAWPREGLAPVEGDMIILFAGVGVLVLLAAALTRVGRPASWRKLGDRQAQTVFRTASRRLAPPIVAAALAANHTESLGYTAAVLAAVLGSSLAFADTGFPFRLGGVARLAFDLLMPAAGIALPAVAALAAGVDLQEDAVVVPLLGAWFVTFAGGWLEEAFNARRPIRMAVIGEPVVAQALAVEMDQAGIRDHCVVGWLTTEEGRHAARMADLERLGSLDELRTVVAEHRIDLLVVAPRGHSVIELFQKAVESCVDLPVRMLQASHLYEEMHGRVPIGAINAAWFAHIMHPRFSPQSDISKRLMDVTVSAALLVLLAPLFAMVAAAVKLGDGGPVFFRQSRVGARGREFLVLKFRTMGIDAEASGVAQWSQAGDSRVTRVGRLLRKSHLDELPQLINVLRGPMSLVGPRPERPEFVAGLEQRIPYYSRRVLVKPGITGWAQVRSGYAGSETGTAFKLCHDLYYIKHRTLLFDVLTMIETLRTLVADPQYREFTFSEAFILGDAELEREEEVVENAAGVGDAAPIAEEAGAPGSETGDLEIPGLSSSERSERFAASSRIAQRLRGG